MPPPENKPRPQRPRSGGPPPNPDIGLEVIVLSAVVIGVLLLGLSPLTLEETTFSLQDVPAKNFFSIALHIWQKYVGPAFIAIDIILLAVLVYVLIQTFPTRPYLRVFGEDLKPRKRVTKASTQLAMDWRRVMSMLDAGTADKLRLAVIEADALVDRFLMNSGYEGEHMADRLSQVLNSVRSLDGVWRAHKLRNALVHTPGIVTTPSEAREAIARFEAFLRELGGL